MKLVFTIAGGIVVGFIALCVIWLIWLVAITHASTKPVPHNAVGSWSTYAHFSDEYQTSDHGPGMACRTGERTIHAWTWLGDSYYFHLWSTACFRLHWIGNHGHPYFSYIHMTPTVDHVCIICSMDDLTFSATHYGCTGAFTCQMTGVRDMAKAEIHYNPPPPLQPINDTQYPMIKFIWRIVPWAPGRGQIGVTTYDSCSGC